MGDVFSTLMKANNQLPETKTPVDLDAVGNIFLTGDTPLKRNVAKRQLLAVLKHNENKFDQVTALTYLLSSVEPLRGDDDEKVKAFIAADKGKGGEVLAMAEIKATPPTH